MSKFVIFASARTGSTSLSKVLGESSDVKMAIEPFHPGFSKWNPGEKDYSKFVTNSRKMDEALDEIFRKYTAIKCLTYQFSEEIYFTMLKRKDLKIIFLRRKNLVAMALSNYIAVQTGEWHKSDKKKLYENLKPVKIEDIVKMIDYVNEMNNTYAKFLKENREGDYLPLFYEDLYSENFSQNKYTLEGICKFLGISMPSDDAIKKHMTPSEAKVGYGDLYKKLPNYNEVEEKFGKLT